MRPFWILLAAPFISCGVSVRALDLEPRYAAVHDAFSAMGFAQVGPFARGTLAQGAESRVRLDLAAACTTIVAFGGRGVNDMGIALVDVENKVIARNATNGAQATLHACIETAGVYTLVVHMDAGAGDFLAATWIDASNAAANARMESAAGSGALGTCDAPIPLSAGAVTGHTSRGLSENEGTCAASRARELVYRLDVRTRARAVIEVDPRFDAVLYVRAQDCRDPSAEVACNDDVGNERKSRVDTVLDPGAYFVFVDGYNEETGAFGMNVQLTQVPTLSEACEHAPALAASVSARASGLNLARTHSNCGAGAEGPDAIYKLELDAPARVRLTETSSEFAPVVHMRRACSDEASEVSCSEAGMTAGAATTALLLGPGHYAVFADAREPDATGDFTLASETAPESGSGVVGDACDDALPLASQANALQADTFFAKDDVAGRCSAPLAPDVVYRFEVAHPTRVVGHISQQEGAHVLSLTQSCSDVAGEIACGDALNSVVGPGHYFMVVDGKTATDFGRFSLGVRLVDVAQEDAASRSAQRLLSGKPITSTTRGGKAHFALSCSDLAHANPDRTYRIALATPARVHLTLTTPATTAFKAIVGLLRAVPGRPELACRRIDDTHRASIDEALETGAYDVVVSGDGDDASGEYTLVYRAER